MSAAITTTTDAPSTKTALGRGVVLLLATACGLSVANLYYAQPILHSLAGVFHVTPQVAGLVVTASQIGYAAGLLLVVPLGDLLARRRIVPAMLLLAALALGACAAAGSISVLVAASAIVGTTSVSAQLLVPFAASLAGPQERGRVVGTVMGGLLTGILLARTVSGLIAQATSWRVVYAAAALVMVVSAAVLRRQLPLERERPAMRYSALLRSTLATITGEALLRRRAVLGALGFAAFSVFWTTVAFLLSAGPFHYGTRVIGLFGLVGAAGALCANLAGRVADRGAVRAATLSFAALMAVSFAVLWLGRTSLVALIAGIVLLDIGVQGLHVTNQSVIYALAPEQRSRINSAYMLIYFAGGAFGSSAGTRVYAAGGWGGVCILGGSIGAGAVLLALAWRSTGQSS
jgi:predicted MFS family arabinose efflux permease